MQIEENCCAKQKIPMQRLSYQTLAPLAYLALKPEAAASSMVDGSLVVVVPSTSEADGGFHRVIDRIRIKMV
jgi:hypothetical protein